MWRARLLYPAIAGVTLALAACGSGDSDEPANAEPTPTPGNGALETPAPGNNAAPDTSPDENANGDTVGNGAPQVYTVQPGDTLGAIAEQFGVTVDAIVEANDIADPDVIAVGQELVIP